MLRRPDPNRVLLTADGSRISEVLGRSSTDDPSCSVAQITMPVGRGQPARQNGFRELMIVVSGSCEVDLPQGTVHLQSGDVLDLPAGTGYA